MLTSSGTHEGTCGLCTRAAKCGTWDAGTFGGKKPLHVYECIGIVRKLMHTKCIYV